MKNEHTPLPWNRNSRIIFSGTQIVANTFDNDNQNQLEKEANARFIVEACNSYYKLKEKELRLKEIEAALSIKGGNEHQPTQWAYDKACDVLHKKTEQIKTAQDLAESTIEEYNKLLPLKELVGVLVEALQGVEDGLRWVVERSDCPLSSDKAEDVTNAAKQAVTKAKQVLKENE